ncbi:hypothetical protein BGX24_002699 [Mortierella sp. AD032]|nr:hypothetical protein BGX24_002699 [Mortierella sp. AD032]
MGVAADSRGGFIVKQEIPVDQATTDYFNILINRNNQAIRELVDPSLGMPPPTPPFETHEDKVASRANLQKLQDLYFSCMDEDVILRAGRQPLLEPLQGIFTFFPPATTTATTADSKTILSKTLAKLFNQGLAGLIDVAVIVDPTDPLAHSLQVKEVKLGLPSKEYYKDVQTVLTYRSIIAQMFHIVLGEEDVALRTLPFTDADVAHEWNAAAKVVVDLETQLAAIGTELFDQFDPVKSNNPRTIAQLSALVPSLDWTLLFAETLIQTVLQATTLKTLRLYFAWVVIKDLGPNLGLLYRRPLQVLNAVIAGTAPELQPPRWKDCVVAINTNLGDMAGYFFIQEFFKGSSRQSVVSIIDSLLQTYAQIFTTLPWLDEPTRTGALQKVQAIQKLIGYSTDSPNVASPISLLSYYFNLTISKSDHFGNQHRYAVWSKALERSQLNDSVNQKKMEESPQIVDAFYLGPTNHIIFPAGILQPPFFHVDNPEYLNYGAMGVAAGHEITHGFDNMGRNYDSAGRVKNWWTDMTEKTFNEKAQCFVDQYGNFTIKGPDGKDYKVNGQLTLGENIADNGGLEHAYSTWQTRYQSDPLGTM